MSAYQLARLAAWVTSHGLLVPPSIRDGAVHFRDHDGAPHVVRTLRAAREALGY